MKNQCMAAYCLQEYMGYAMIDKNIPGGRI